MRKMNILVCLMILVILVIPTIGSATQVNEKLGPYSINFSTPADIYTKIDIQDNLETYGGIKFQRYDLNLISKNTNVHVGTISILHYDKIIDIEPLVTLSPHEDIKTQDNIGEITGYNRIIDGIPGHLYKGKSIDESSNDGYAWGYALNYQNIVNGGSFMPWDNSTSEMLDTLHIDVIGN